MRWESGRRSDNIEDRRSGSSGGKLVKGGLGTVVIVVVAMLLGVDPSLVLNTAGPILERAEPAASRESDAPDEMGQFVSTVLADTEDVWSQVFHQEGRQYQEPVMVLFSGSTSSACGSADSASGPFYCPGDQKIYIDLAFYRTLRDRLGADGDFAQAYVIAHEVGHHVQNLLGIAPKVHQAMQRTSEVQANALSVRLELQADCLAGVWANHAHRSRKILERGDIEEAMNAAAAIGDDQLQRRSQGHVVPDSFTHGSSAQRMRWFKRGLDTGKVSQCDTFSRNVSL